MFHPQKYLRYAVKRSKCFMMLMNVFHSNKECPTCRKKLVSKRSLRPDPNFDALISKEIIKLIIRTYGITFKESDEKVYFILF